MRAEIGRRSAKLEHKRCRQRRSFSICEKIIAIVETTTVSRRLGDSYRSRPISQQQTGSRRRDQNLSLVHCGLLSPRPAFSAWKLILSSTVASPAFISANKRRQVAGGNTIARQSPRQARSTQKRSGARRIGCTADNEQWPWHKGMRLQ